MTTPNAENTTPAPAAPSATGAPAAAAAPAAAPAVGSEDAVALKAELAAMSEQVAHMAEAMLAGVPDHLRALIPAELSPAARVAWFLKARDTGVFTAKAGVPETDTRKPAITPKTPDLSTLPPVARIAHGYKN